MYLVVETAEVVTVHLTDGCYLPTLGTVSTEVAFGAHFSCVLCFHVLNCVLGCALGLQFLRSVNPCIDWGACQLCVGSVELDFVAAADTASHTTSIDVVITKVFSKGVK